MTGREGADELSQRLSRHVCETDYAKLPSSTIHATKRALLDGIGVMLAASGLSEEARPFLAVAEASKDPQATILGTGMRVSAEAAAFANGALAHALDFEDAFDGAPVHPNASLIPSALATAEAQGNVTGSQLIAAVATACDLVCRLGLSLERPMEEGGWYPPPILGAFGAVAASAILRGLTPRQLLDAFSLTLLQVSCPGEIKYSAKTIIRAVREAFPAKAAITSVELASRGVRGFDAPFEGKAGFFRLYVEGEYDPDALFECLGKRFWIEELSFKPWPACRGTHAFIEAAQALARDHRIDWRDVHNIDLEGGEVQQMLFYPEEQKKRPSTPIDAKFSLPFTIALALVKGDVDLDSFSDEWRSNPDVLKLASRVSYHRREDWGRERATSGAVTLLLSDGRQFRSEIESALGSPARPLSDDQLCSKFIACAERARRPINREKADDLARRILNLENEPDVGPLVADLVGD